MDWHETMILTHVTTESGSSRCQLRTSAIRPSARATFTPLSFLVLVAPLLIQFREPRHLFADLLL